MVEVENFLPVLTVILLLMTVGSILFFNFDIMQPSIVIGSIMTISSFLGVLNIQRWNLFVGSYTTIIFIGGMIAFFCGSIFTQYYCFSHADIIKKISIEEYSVSSRIILLITLGILFLAYMSGNEMYHLSLTFGNNDGLLNMIKTIRYPLERGEIAFSRWMRYRNLIAMSIATVFLYVFIYKIIFTNKKVKKVLIYLLPILAVIPFFFLSTGRRSIVHFIITGCVIVNILYQQKNGYDRSTRLYMLKILGIAGLFAIICYFIMGLFTGKVQIGGRSLLIIISHYGGLSIPALDVFLNSTFLENQYIGQNTLMGIYGNLNTLGFHLEKGRAFLPFVQFTGTDNINTNVYTVMYRLIADWSLPGMIIVMFIFGAFLTLGYNYLKYHTCPTLLVLYAYFGYIPFFLFIDDQFMTLFATNNIYFSILCAIILKSMRLKNRWASKP